MKNLLLHTSLLFICLNTNAQKLDLCKDLNADRPGKLVIHADPLLDRLIYMKKKEVGREAEFQGYRVQVYLGTNRAEANKLKIQIAEEYPDVEIYFKYDAPNFKIRVGNFRSRLEALKVLHDIRQNYPGASLVPEKVRFPKF